MPSESRVRSTRTGQKIFGSDHPSPGDEWYISFRMRPGREKKIQRSKDSPVLRCAVFMCTKIGNFFTQII